MGSDRLEVAVERICGLLESLRSELALLRQPSPGVDVDLLGAEDVARMLGISERSFRRLRARRKFPKPLAGPGPLRWKRRTIEGWLEGRR